MATTKQITDKQFQSLIDELDRFKCMGSSHNVERKPQDWDTVHFKYDGTSQVGLDFCIAHPLSKDKTRIDYDTLEVRFYSKYPFVQESAYRITDPTQVEKLQNAVAPYLEHYLKSA
jgi:hypothetical protein